VSRKDDRAEYERQKAVADEARKERERAEREERARQARLKKIESERD